MDTQKTKLSKSGLKSTEARLAILEILEKEQIPLDVETILSGLKKRKIAPDLVTVYRILDKFVENNLIQKLEFQEGKYRYEINSHDHYHAVCNKCGKVFEAMDCPIEAVEKDIAKKLNFQINRHTLVFYGLCKDCR